MSKSFLEETKARFDNKIVDGQFFPFGGDSYDFDKEAVKAFIESELKRFAEVAVNEMEKDNAKGIDTKDSLNNAYEQGRKYAFSKAQEIVKKLIS